MAQSTVSQPSFSQSGFALSNLRAFVILIVVAVHSCVAYVSSAPAKIAPFDQAPYDWLAFPIIDSHRWFGFDLFCAWQDVSLMATMFFLSGMLAAPSLMRKGGWKYLGDRARRIAVPFAFVVVYLIPLALYPAYAQRAAHPSVAGFFQAWVALPFWPNGPAWFLWQLFVLNALAALLILFAPQWLDRLAQFSSWARRRPAAFFWLMVAASALAYAPLALAFSPWRWRALGPFSLQLCRPALYFVFFFAAFAIGCREFDDGLLGRDGPLAQRWAHLLVAAVAGFMLWGGVTSFTLPDWFAAPLVARLASSLAFPLACTAGALSFLALCLRFARRRFPLLDSVSANAYGIYLAHYPFVVWLPFLLLPYALPAPVKAAIVFGGSLGLSWTSSVVFTRLLIGGSPAAAWRAASPTPRGSPAGAGSDQTVSYPKAAK
jgi:hypothetical protein